MREVQIEIPQILKKCGKIQIEIHQFQKVREIQMKILNNVLFAFWSILVPKDKKNTQKLFPHFFDQITSRELM